MLDDDEFLHALLLAHLCNGRSIPSTFYRHNLEWIANAYCTLKSLTRSARSTMRILLSLREKSSVSSRSKFSVCTYNIHIALVHICITIYRALYSSSYFFSWNQGRSVHSTRRNLLCTTVATLPVLRLQKENILFYQSSLSISSSRIRIILRKNNFSELYCSLLSAHAVKHFLQCKPRKLHPKIITVACYSVVKFPSQLLWES